MKNKKKKRTSSYLLIFLSIIAVLLLLIILYLTFFGKNRPNNTNLAKNTSDSSQALDSDNGETDGFISGDEASGNEGADEDTSVQGPSQQHFRNNVFQILIFFLIVPNGFSKKQ